MSVEVVVFVLLQIVFCECQLYVCTFNKVVLEKKSRSIDLISKKTNLHVQHAFLPVFAVVLHDYHAVLYD